MSALDRIYELATDDADASDPATDEIAAEAVDDVPRNFSLNALNGASTKLAEQLASPGAVLALLIGIVGAPVAFVGLLEPVRRGASLAPQLAVSGRVRDKPRRKWYWVGAGMTQAAALVAMLVAAATLEGLAAGLAIIACLAIFAGASGVGSVAFSDVVGKTVPESKRGQMLALRATAGGALTLTAGLALTQISSSDGLGVFLALLGVAAALWFGAALLFAAITEPAGEPVDQRSPLEEARAGLRAFSSFGGLRLFAAARGLLLAVELAVPFLVVFTRDQLTDANVLATVVIAIGLANLLSNYAWGRIADRISTRLTMIAAGVLGSAAIGGVLVLSALADSGTTILAFAPVFFFATAAESGIRVGRKAWVVNAAPEQERPLWVAATNTFAGVITLGFAALGLLAQLAGVDAVIYTLLGLSLAGVAMAWLMPEDDEPAVG